MTNTSEVNYIILCQVIIEYCTKIQTFDTLW